ncbi:MAG: chaperone modulator CbpM [Candidatus Sericytochromatia bacterium]
MKVEYITLQELCRSFQIEPAILDEFAEAGLFTPQEREGERYLAADDLAELEAMIRLFQDFAINPDGLGIISQMRRRILDLESRLSSLQHHLERFDRFRPGYWEVEEIEL